jgi:hypothetical protein
MADVDYMKYAAYMGARNPIATGLNDLGDTVDQDRKMKMLEGEGQRRNSLVDLQIKQHQMSVAEAERVAGEKAKLRNSLSSLQPTVTPAQQSQEQLNAYTTDALAYAQGRMPQMAFDQEMNGGAGGDAPNPAYMQAQQQFNTAIGAPAIPAKVTPPDPMDALFKYGMETGDYDPATKALNVEAVLRKRSAQARAYGDIATSDKLDAEIEKGTKIATIVSTLGKADTTGNLLRQMITSLPDVFKGIDPSTIKITGDMTEFTGNGFTMVVGPDGKSHIVKEAKDTKGFDTVDLGDRIKYIPRDGTKPYYEPKGITPGASAKEGKPDPVVVREAVKDLPKLRKEANMASASQARLDQMIKLYDKGSAGGLKGNILQSISGVFDVSATSEAELFKKLASAGAGQLRSTVIGPGQVSNYEQKLLQSVSGGGSGARTAIRELLLFYKQEADRTIGNYDEAVDAAASLEPSVAKAFKKVGGKAATPAGTGKQSGRFTVEAL